MYGDPEAMYLLGSGKAPVITSKELIRHRYAQGASMLVYDSIVKYARIEG
jgi:hypothetical protein